MAYFQEVIHFAVESVAYSVWQSITVVVHHALDVNTSQVTKGTEVLVHLGTKKEEKGGERERERERERGGGGGRQETRLSILLSEQLSRILGVI